jgi:arylsulfatase A-like enzyme
MLETPMQPTAPRLIPGITASAAARVEPTLQSPSPTLIRLTATFAPTILPSPSPTSVELPPKHIILIMVDSLRADHTSAHGYFRQTTPNLDALVASKGVRFDPAISTAPWTCPSVAAVHTGRNPTSLGFSFETMGHTLPDSANTLAEYLQKAGYHTAGFSTTYCTQGRLGFSQGFDLYDDTFSNRPSNHKALAAEVNQHILAWLDNEWLSQSPAESPLFLFIYYFDPHVCYDPPPPYDQHYDSGYNGPLTPQGFGIGQPVVSGEIEPNARDVEHLQALYDGEISYWDENLGKMITALEERHLMDNTLFVVTADHGEMFGEHQKWTHMSSLYEEVLRVPFMMRYDGIIPAGTRILGPVQNYDLMPTILDWAGIPIPEDLQAASLKSQILEGLENTSRPAYAEVNGLTDKKSALYWNAPRKSQYSIEQDGWKLIHNLGNSELDELYSLKGSSMYETQNLIQTETNHAALLWQRLSAWFNLKY